MNDRAIGRAGFLGILGAGAVGLFFAKDVDRPPRSGGADVRLGDRADGRMADLHHRPTRCRTSTRRRIGSRSTGSSTTPPSFSLAGAEGNAPGRAGLGLPLRHRVERERMCAGEASGSPTCSTRVGADKSVRGASVRLGRDAVRGLADARAGAASRRDARLRDGRRPDLATARRARSPRDARTCTATRASSGSSTSSSAAPPQPASGSSTATTRTHGSGSRMATRPDAAVRPADRALHPHRARAPLGARRRRSSPCSRPG